MKVSVIIPMYNESAVVADTARTLTAYLEDWCGKTGHTFEVVFSNDGSSDDCGSQIRAFSDSHSFSHGTVTLVEAERNYGKGHAVGLGMASASGDFLLYTDCDLAYGTQVIGMAAEEFAKGDCDALIGSRNLSADGYEGYTFARKTASRVYILVLCLVAGFRMSDSQCGFKGFSRQLGQAVFRENRTWGWAFDIEILLRAERKQAVIREMPVKIIHHRESKIHLVRDSIRMLRDILKIRKRLKQEAAVLEKTGQTPRKL